VTRYLGQCNVVRRRGAAEEALWHAMIAAAHPISKATFLRHVDLSPLLDDGETAQGFLRTVEASDPDATMYESMWGHQRCWYLQTSGFEFIFVE